jgi:penicillin-binding protein 2
VPNPFLHTVMAVLVPNRPELLAPAGDWDCLRAAVANGGKLYRPRLVSKVESLDGSSVREFAPELIRTIEMKPDTLARVHNALADVVKGGTGGMARSPLIEVAGKTGTA